MAGVKSRTMFVLRCVSGWLACAAVAVLSTGCQSAGTRTVQVQFYAPEGSTVVLRDVDDLSAEVRSHGPLGNRFEHEAEDFAVYDLPAGRYSLAYMGGAGAKDATIYGELEVRSPSQSVAREFVARTFVPIRLASVDHQEAEHLFPSRDLSYTEGLERREFEHIQQGDFIEQVYFVADLERAKYDYDVAYYQAIQDVDRELAVLSDREEYIDVRYDAARRTALFRNPDVNVEDQIAQERFDLWGVEEPFIKIAEKRQALARERESLQIVRRDLEDERGRRNALLRSMKIVHRAGALTLATPDLKMPFRESVEQASQLGEVLAVLRIGGRHQYWAMGRAGGGSGE